MTKNSKQKSPVERTVSITDQRTVKSKPYVKEFILNPYRQGRFDGLCGLYSIINAVRLIATNADGLNEELYDVLFHGLIRHAELKYGTRRLLKNGCPQRLIRSMLRGSRRFVATRSKLTITTFRPLLGKGRLTLDEVLEIIRRQLASQRSSIIVEIGGLHTHWTVIRKVTAGQVYLFDSDGLKVLNISEMRMSYEKPNPRAKHRIVAGSVFMLTRWKP